MYKLLIILITIMLGLTFYNLKNVKAEIPIKAHYIVDGLKEFQDRGVYRIDDHDANYHVYIVITKQQGVPPQISAVPMQR